MDFYEIGMVLLLSILQIYRFKNKLPIHEMNTGNRIIVSISTFRMLSNSNTIILTIDFQQLIHHIKNNNYLFSLTIFARINH